MKELINKHRQDLLQFMRFVLVGGSAFLIDFTINSVIVASLRWEPKIESFFANTVSYSLTLIYNYLMSSRWTFNSIKIEQRNKVKYKFIGVNIFNLVWSSFVIAWFVGILHTPYFAFIPEGYKQPLAKFVITSFMVVSSFILYRKFVFKG